VNRLDPLAVVLSGTNLIEASAGTGKTQTITTLYLRLVLEQRLTPADILVVTYTNAATAELRTRIRDRLALALAAVESGGRGSGDEAIDALLARRHSDPLPGPPPLRRGGEASRRADRDTLALALQGFDEAAIHTIHGFCQRVLHEHAFESGVSFATELVTDQTSLLEEVVQDFWVRRLSEAPEALVRDLLKKNPYQELITLAARVTSDPDMEVLPPTVDADLDAVLDSRRRAFERARRLWTAERAAIMQRLERAAPGLRQDTYKIAAIRTWPAQLDAAFAVAEPMVKECAVLRYLAAGTLEQKKNKNGTAPRHEFFDVCQELIDCESALDSRLKSQQVGFRLDLVRYARAELPRRKEALDVQYFDDLLHRLASALEGDGGELLAERVRRRFRAALIDEFQDTDPVQYRIFRRVYHRPPAAGLFLIGDPKQAIYAFRGADVFAYMEAKRDAGAALHTLQTNWRSDPGLLGAVNFLFGRIDEPFVFDAIPYLNVDPRPGARDQLGGAGDLAPLRILFGGGETFATAKRPVPKNRIWPRLPRFVAADISRLLASRTKLAGKPVEASDVAVLCRTNRQAADVQRELRALGVPNVLQGDASVFDTAEAEEVQRLVAALAEPADAAALRAAMATPVVGLDAEALLALGDDERAWDEWATRFQRWHDVWRKSGFIPAFRRLLDECRVNERLLGLVDGERRLTNVLHLGELLQTAVRETRRGPLALVEWLGRMRADAQARAELGSEAAQIRLESDARALRLTTIHKSKGLEYPIVYCPYLWDGSLLKRADEAQLRFHDPADDNRLKLDLGSPDRGARIDIARREALAENLRLLYVALTRAKHHTSVVWGPLNDASTSALGYVLHQRRGGAGPDVAEATAEHIFGLGEESMREEIERLACDSGGAIEVQELRTDAGVPHRPAEREGGELRWRPWQRALLATWRTGSFSSLTAGGGPLGAPGEEGIDHDEVDEGEGPMLGRPSEGDVVLADFPAGPRAGRLVHEVLEHLDFRAGDGAIADAAGAALLRHRLGNEWAVPLAAALRGVLETPLDDAAPPLRLCEIARERRLAELEFVFPVGGGDGADGGGSFTAAGLAAVLARHGGERLTPSYVDSVRRLAFRPLAGFLKGYIDLVFEHRGRWYVVDYKSNRLGRRASQYGAEAVARAMEQHHYFLQYHLYVVALHRYLELRLAGYDYERHFGGVFYLFLRGMAPSHPTGSGVFRDRPSRRLVEQLSAALAGRGERNAA
jgi:exodeoxyribonuclease V beta subunit